MVFSPALQYDIILYLGINYGIVILWNCNGVDGPYPLVIKNIAAQLLKMAIEIVDLPIKNCDFP